jgi:hypothetical protein
VPSIAAALLHPSIALGAFSGERTVDLNLNNWLGQVTTGHGAMILGSTLIATASGTMTWTTALPFVAAGLIGLLWPENTPLMGAAQKVVTDVETLIIAYRAGLRHAAPGETPAAAPVAVGKSAATIVAIAMLAAAAVGLGACAGQTPAQVAATQTAVASGLLCIADASGKVVQTVSTNDSNTLKAVNSAMAAGNVLLTDAACQAALVNGVAALPRSATTPAP